MASWMIHLRVADRLLDRLPGLSPVEFIVGNLAPDSGVPTEEGFVPDTPVSHFRTGILKADPEAFAQKYLTDRQLSGYDARQLGFYLGYLSHLMTDRLWSIHIALPTFRAEVGGDPPYRGPLVDRIKDNWVELDRRYLDNHPGFRAFRVYLGAVGFRNNFMEEFSADAFDLRRQHITDFYLRGAPSPDRPTLWLTAEEADRFVDLAVRETVGRLEEYKGYIERIC